MNGLWLLGLLRTRVGRLAGTAAGVAITVALVTTLSLFLVHSGRSMTARAVAAVPIDWQVEAVPGAEIAGVREAIGKAAKTTSIQQVNYARTSGLEAATGATVQTTGPGKIIAFDKSYLRDFPQEVRLLSGTMDGALAAQQTAANLHIGPGDTVSVGRVGLPAEPIRITGIVELPDADSLFQSVGLPPQAAAQAPPDNVLILPPADWTRIFAPQQAARPDTTRIQLHVRLDHAALPARPEDAWIQVTGAARNLEAQVAGQALVANNLAARLDAVRGDSLYATVLFLFLGVPGIILAGVLTFAITAAGGARRRAEQALLRIRGASISRILVLSLAESLAVGFAGILIGLAGATAFARLQFGAGEPASGAVLGFAVIAGLLVSIAAFAYPAWRDPRSLSVNQSRQAVRRGKRPIWQRLWLDVVLLAGSSLLFWQSASTGYQIVLAPEGVAATSVDYNAFIAPALFWLGSALLTVRLSGTIIAANGAMLRALVRPAAGRLAPVVAAALSHQTGRITAAIAMTALAVSFAVSTSIFNTTYNAQSRVDAELTNGADVTVFGSTADPASAWLARLSALPDVVAAEPMQHRFAYVGADLQDIYGIDPATIGKATSLSDAYFAGATATQTLARLAATPNGVLVSDETVQDFQLSVGDNINLRLISAADNQYHAVPFTFIGVAREFPTAPKDSFLVANASYIAKTTGSDAGEYVLVKSAGDPAALARAVAVALADDPSLKVRDIESAAHIIGSNLTAVDLSGLTFIELAFALAMAAAAAGLMLGLGFLDRQRAFAILSAIGARPNQLAAFLWAEGLVIAIGGLVFGLWSGLTMAWMLVKLLTGVFDPPPEALSVPSLYLVVVLVLLIASLVAAVMFARGRSERRTVELLREF